MEKDDRKYLEEILKGYYHGEHIGYIYKDTRDNVMFASAEPPDWWFEDAPSFKLCFKVKLKK